MKSLAIVLSLVTLSHLSHANDCIIPSQIELIYKNELVKDGILTLKTDEESQHYFDTNLQIANDVISGLQPVLKNGAKIGFKSTLNPAGGSGYRCTDAILDVTCEGKITKNQWPTCYRED